jgi:hypothetical protein
MEVPCVGQLFNEKAWLVLYRYIWISSNGKYRMCEKIHTCAQYTAGMLRSNMVVQDDAVVSLHMVPPRSRGWRSRGLVCLVPGGRVLAGQLLFLEWWRGVQNPLAAGQGETVPGAVLVLGAVRNVPCGPLRLPARKIPVADGRQAGGPWPLVAKVVLWGCCRASAKV